MRFRQQSACEAIQLCDGYDGGEVRLQGLRHWRSNVGPEPEGETSARSCEEQTTTDEPSRASATEYQVPESVAECEAGDGSLKPTTLLRYRNVSATTEAATRPST